MKVALLTYHAPHRKTQQALAGLALQPELQLRLYGLPFHERAARSPRFRHRPDMWTAGHPNEVAQHYGLEYCKIESVGDIDQPFDVALIAGAGLLPTDFVVNNTILNCHGGLIPSVRGLDAFKWAIYDSQPLGNTLHIIDADVDAGKPLKALRTPVYADDSLEMLAQRHYELELQLLCAFPHFLENPQPLDSSLPNRPPRKRMPASIEMETIELFPRYIEEYAYR